MSEATGLEDRLRAHGRAVEARRKPVDVDAIISGMVALPNRRVARRGVTRRWAPMLVGLALLLVVGVLGVRSHQATDQRVVVPGVSAPAPAPAPAVPLSPQLSAPGASVPRPAPVDPSSPEIGAPPTSSPNDPMATIDPSLWSAPMPALETATYTHTSPDGRWTVAVWVTEGPQACTPGVESCPFIQNWVIDNDSGKAGSHGFGGTDAEGRSTTWGAVSNDLGATVMRLRPDVARVDADVKLADGRTVTETLVPVDRVVAFVSASDGAAPFADVRLFAADGTPRPL